MEVEKHAGIWPAITPGLCDCTSDSPWCPPCLPARVRSPSGSRATTGGKITFDAGPSWSASSTAGPIQLTFTATGARQIYHDAKEHGNSGRIRLTATATLTVNAAP
jgi:hypothetical protein